MRELISLRAFGLSELDAVRYYVALKMAEHGLLTAPNMAVGEPFNVGLTAAAVTGAGSTALPGVPTDGGGIAGVPGGTAVVREPGHQAPRTVAQHSYLPSGTGARQGVSGVAGP